MSDARLSKATDPARENRAMQDRAVEGRRDTESIMAELRKQSFQNALPDLPPVQGYHVCWLTTSSTYDTIAGRMNRGYEPLLMEDCPGWTFNNVKGAAHEGWPISCNEMVAAKLPQDLYEAMMKYFHHELPNGEESRLAETARNIQEQAKAKGADVQISDGQRALGRNAAAPLHW